MKLKEALMLIISSMKNIGELKKLFDNLKQKVINKQASIDDLEI
jgi:hypothetical protein